MHIELVSLWKPYFLRGHVILLAFIATIPLSLTLSVCLYLNLSLSLLVSVCLSVSFSVSRSVSLFVSPFLCLSLCPSLCLPHSPSLCVSLCLCVCLSLILLGRVSLNSSGCAGTCSIEQAGLKLRSRTSSASLVLGIMAYATTAQALTSFFGLCKDTGPATALGSSQRQESIILS